MCVLRDAHRRPRFCARRSGNRPGSFARDGPTLYVYPGPRIAGAGRQHSMMELNELRRLVRDVPDFPKPGIMFRDITPLIGDARAFAAMVDLMAEPFLGKVDTVL